MTHQIWSGIVKREFALALRQRSELVQPWIFLLIVVTLFPLGVGPSPALLSKIGGGIIWIAAILSAMLSMERMLKDDFVDGSLEQMILSGLALYWIALAKVSCHWITTFAPLVLLTPLLAMFLNLDVTTTKALVLTLLIGTPVLSFVGAIGIALTVGLKKGGAVLPLLILPIYIPLLIFATAAIDSASSQLPYHSQLAIIGALLLLSVALAPFAIAYAMRVSQH